MCLEQFNELVRARALDQVSNPDFIPSAIMDKLDFGTTDTTIPILYEIVYAIEYKKRYPVDVVVGKNATRPLWTGADDTSGIVALQDSGVKLMRSTFNKYICSITPDDGDLYGYILAQLADAHGDV